MESLNRRHAFAAIGGIFAAMLGQTTKAQTQTVGNGARIVSTGDVHLNQDAAASQTVIVRDGHGNIVRGATQTVTNDGQIVSTGDVYVDQAASGDQQVFADQQVVYDGSVSCQPGTVWADARNGELWYCDNNECPQRVPCCVTRCKSGRC